MKKWTRLLRHAVLEISDLHMPAVHYDGLAGPPRAGGRDGEGRGGRTQELRGVVPGR